MSTKILAVWIVATQAFTNLKANDPVRMAGATAFFAFFALPPIIILLSQILGQLFGDQAYRVSSQLVSRLSDLFGNPGAHQIQDIAQHLQQRRDNVFMTLLSVVLLLLASTTMFAVVKGSLNQLWNVKARPNRHLGHTLADKAVALGLIGLLGVLFILSLAMSQIGAFVTPNANLTVVARQLRSLLLLIIWIAFVFRYLPDFRVRWSAIWLGACVTGVLIEIGEAVLDRFLIHSSVGSLYGASGAIILVLLFVFYAALIFYYGASFTRQYTHRFHLDMEPKPTAVAYEIKEIDP